MKIDKTTGISLGALALILPMIAGSALWYDGTQQEEHMTIVMTAVAGDVELSLQQINLELKMFRMIVERRVLTADEADRKTYLEALRVILLVEQKKRVA